jgi:hypothetical protein
MDTADLDAFIDEGLRRSIDRHYHPHIFIGMRRRLGTVEAISHLVRSGEIQSGFKKLEKLGLLDWSIEEAVVRFQEHFTKDDLECAQFRLACAKKKVL